jgi:hypothetical protein
MASSDSQSREEQKVRPALFNSPQNIYALISLSGDNDGLHKLTTPVGGVAFEVVGQVTNLVPAGPGQPATSHQYGYLSTINGLSANQVFNTSFPTSQNETTARFTFFTDAITERIISNGRLRIVNRTGTTTIYLDELSPGDFGNRDTFRDGIPILRMNYRQQVILDTGEANRSVPGSGTFTVMNLLTITDVTTFEIGGERYQIGRVKDQFRQFYSVAAHLGPTERGICGFRRRHR